MTSDPSEVGVGGGVSVVSSTLWMKKTFTNCHRFPLTALVIGAGPLPTLTRSVHVA